MGEPVDKITQYLKDGVVLQRVWAYGAFLSFDIW